MDTNKLMSLEVAILNGADFLVRKLDPVIIALEDETEIPSQAIPTIQDDIVSLRKSLDELERLLTTDTGY